MVCREIQKTRLVWAGVREPVGRGPILGSPGRATVISAFDFTSSFGRFSDRNALQSRLPAAHVPLSRVLLLCLDMQHQIYSRMVSSGGFVSSDILGTDLDPPRWSLHQEIPFRDPLRRPHRPNINAHSVPFPYQYLS
jgi:hypothetical protein